MVFFFIKSAESGKKPIWTLIKWMEGFCFFFFTILSTCYSVIHFYSLQINFYIDWKEKKNSLIIIMYDCYLVVVHLILCKACVSFNSEIALIARANASLDFMPMPQYYFIFLKQIFIII